MSEQQAPVPALTAEEHERLSKQIMKATAVRTAMIEVVKEQQAEIVRRARAKLTAMGVEVSDAELGAEV